MHSTYKTIVLLNNDVGQPTHHTVEYSAFVKHLAKPLANQIEDVLHAAVGISGEAGELIDSIKKTWIYNKPLDRENIVEELGDLNWYIQHLQNVLGITDEEIMAHNTQKLNVRYAKGYSDKAAQERADKQ